jgi:hypothetical protein
MPRPSKVRPNWAAPATICDVSDALWAVLEPLIAEVDPAKDDRASTSGCARGAQCDPLPPAQPLPAEPVARALPR